MITDAVKGQSGEDAYVIGTVSVVFMLITSTHAFFEAQSGVLLTTYDHHA